MAGGARAGGEPEAARGGAAPRSDEPGPGRRGGTEPPGTGQRAETDRPLHAVFDPFAGIAGDMVLGCWIDLGLDRDWLLDVAERLGVAVGDIRVERVERAGLSAAKVTVVGSDGTVEGPPGHVPAASGGRGAGRGHHEHGRRFADIRRRVEESRLEERARALALGAFGRLAAAEARVHGVDPEDVHFHELGAVDALIDICGAADGFVRLGVGTASATAVALGGGTVRIAHGTYPVPAPATAYLLEGTTVRHAGYPYETVTPTGAALLAELCGGREPEGDAVVRAVGYGAGTLDPAEHPNCLRVWLVEPAADRAGPVLVLQTDVDDMSPEYVPRLLDACLEAGALDAVVYGVQMKKGRPGWRLEVQVRPEGRDAVEEAVFRHSTTLGIRSWPVGRRVLGRRIERREWRGHPIRVKVRETPGDGPAGRGKPEHDDVVAAAAAEGMDPAEVVRWLRREWPDLD